MSRWKRDLQIVITIVGHVWLRRNPRDERKGFILVLKLLV